MLALERRIGQRQRCDPSAGSRAGMAGAASAAPNINLRPRPILTYCGRKMVRTLGATSQRTQVLVKNLERIS